MGDSFRFAEVSFITKKEKYDEEQKKSNTEYKKKKERRKSIQNSAPAALLAKLDTKLLSLDKEKVEKIHIPQDQFWYNHHLGYSDEDRLNSKTVNIDGLMALPHTAYRAFLLLHYDTNKACFNQEMCDACYEQFKENYKTQIKM